MKKYFLTSVFGLILTNVCYAEEISLTWDGSTTTGKSNTVGTPSTTAGKVCWCQVTGFSPTSDDYSDGPQCTVSDISSKYVFRANLTDNAKCLTNCAYQCQSKLYGNGDTYTAYRAAMFSTAK